MEGTMNIENEQSVVVRFAQIAASAGWEILSVQTAFPDMSVRVDGEVFRCELEYESINFARHGHDPRACDLIICYLDNWQDSTLPVFTLGRIEAGVRPTRAMLPSQEAREIAYWRGRALLAESRLKRELDTPEERNPGASREEVLGWIRANPNATGATVSQVFGVSERTGRRYLAEARGE
jgi:hypothetical protein